VPAERVVPLAAFPSEVNGLNIRTFAVIGVTLAAAAQQPGVNFYSVEKEIEFGRQQAVKLAETLRSLDSPAAKAYVDRMVQELAKQIADSRFPYLVTLVQDGLGAEPKVLMGGQIFLSAEQIRAARSEGEFVGLLADAMARVVDRDASRSASRNTLRQMASASAERVRDFDLQADALAAKTLVALGYSPIELADYLERTLKNDDPRRVAALRATASPAVRKDSDEYLRMRESIAK
jgi:predicted Zn-dependent protease